MFDEVPQSETERRVLRFLFAAGDGIDLDLLTPEEKNVVDDLRRQGVVELWDGRARIDPNGVAAGPEARERFVASSAEDTANHAPTELDRLRRQEWESRTLFEFIQSLTGNIIRATSIRELFASAFTQLAGPVDFSIGTAIMVEQNLELYISRRAGTERVIGKRFETEIRNTMQGQLNLSFEDTDVVIVDEQTNLRGAAPEWDPFEYCARAVIQHENRIAGVLVIFRAGRPFRPEEQKMLQILSGQVSILLDNIRAHERIQNLADTDELTGIPNRRFFRSRLSSEIDRARIYSLPLSLLLLDVDEFKQINDSWGHMMGDVVLSELCGAVKETLRPTDIFARYGGDELAVILFHTDLWGARSVAERIVQLVRKLDMHSESGAAIGCTVSIGIATYVPPDMTAADLIQRADERLYLSKKSGKNRYSW